MEDIYKRKNKTKILLVTFSCLLLLAIGYHLIFTLDIFRKREDNLDYVNDIIQDENETLDNTIEEEETILFTGKYISATLPNGWRIEEYENGIGSNMLNPEETYSGLTGLKIFKDGIELFTMQAVSGLGFAGCPNYAKFEDESTAYYQQTLTDNEVSGQELEIHDFTSTPYTEFTWLGLPFRRVEKTYVYDVNPGNQYFESSCVFTLLSFYDLTLYRIDGKYGSSAYDFGPTEIATPQDLEIIDEILESMSLVN